MAGGLVIGMILILGKREGGAGAPLTKKVRQSRRGFSSGGPDSMRLKSAGSAVLL